MGIQRVIVAMPDELVAAVDAAAKKQDRSRSWMIRHAVEQTFMSRDLVVTWGPGQHGFVPQKGNALRCDVCGQRQSAHPKERTQ
jgi:Ribbon-helix-helix protein, copG family